VTKFARETAAATAVVAIALLVCELSIYRRPDLTRTGAFLFSDAGYSLFVASAVLDGARLYRDVAYPYGWLPVALYTTVAALFGNTPTVYLQFFAAFSTAGLVLAFALFRRFLPLGATLAVTIGGLLPVFVVPGALLGGYISSYYMPVERLLLVLAALIWRPPVARTPARSACLGVVVAALQMTRFGPGVVLMVVLLAVDAILVMGTPRRRAATFLRSALPMVAAAAAGEFALAVAAFALLPRPIALDVLWPAYFVKVFASGVHRWPDVSNWRLVVAQYFNPGASIALTVAGIWTVARRRHPTGDRESALFLLPVLFAGGIFTVFKTDHHLRQFAWVFVFGSVPALAHARWSRFVAIAGWVPVAAVVALALVRHADPGRVMIQLPTGWRLSASRSERERIEGIHRALDSLGARPGGRPAMFDSNGAGFYVIYGVPHVSRHTWFYPAAVRPYDLQELAMLYRTLGALVVCRPDAAPAGDSGSILNDTFPEPLRPGIAARASEAVWSDDRCKVFKLQPASPS